MNRLELAALSLFAALLLPAPAAAHGGVFPPPPVGGGDAGAGPGHSGPSRPSRSPRPTGGPRTPVPKGPKAAPSSGSKPLPTTPARSVPDLSDWTWWWAFNEDPYVDLRRRVRSASTLTGTEAFYVGQSVRTAPASLAPGRGQIQQDIGPALLAAYGGSRDVQLRSAALVALAKLHASFDPPGDTTFTDLAREALADSNQQVAFAAMLALGLIADGESAALLVEIAADQDSAKKLVGRSSVPAAWRVHAVLSLGLVGALNEREEVRRFCVHQLVRLLEEEKPASPDLHIACVTAMGLSPLGHTAAGEASKQRRGPTPSSSRLGQVQFLCDLLADTRRPEYVRAHIPAALGRLGGGAAEPVRELATRAVLEELSKRSKSKTLVRYGCVEALGLLGDADTQPLDEEVRETLRTYVRDGDAFERNLALISLALASSRPGYGGGDPLDGLRAEQVFLMKYFSNAKNRSRPWAALAMGLQGYHARAAGGEVFESTSKGLRRTFERTRNSVEEGAYCIAFGLRRDQEAVESMLERLEKTGDDAARGRIAVSLGLVGAKQAIEPLEEIVRESRYHPSLLRDAAVGLALLGQKQVAEDLVEILTEGRSAAVQGAAVSAIGFVGDARVVDPLLELLADDRQLDLTRAFAATALGLVCEAQAFHWSANFNNHMNYNALVDTLSNQQGSGYLNRR